MKSEIASVRLALRSPPPVSGAVVEMVRVTSTGAAPASTKRPFASYTGTSPVAPTKLPPTNVQDDPSE